MTPSKMKNLSRTVLMMLSVGALVLTAGPVAMAQPEAEGNDGYAPQKRGNGRSGRRGKMRGKRLERMKATLGLSHAQVEQIKAIHTGQRAQRKQFRQQIRPLRRQLKALLAADPLNEAQVLAVHNQLRSVRQLVGEQRFKTRLQVMRVLTGEQRVKLMTIKGKRFKRGMRRGRGMRSGRGMGGMGDQWNGNPQR